MSRTKVFVVQELVGDWEGPSVSSLVGCYSSLESAKTATCEHAKSLSDEARSQICGYETAFMRLLDDGVQEVYCSVYVTLEQAAQSSGSGKSWTGGDP